MEIIIEYPKLVNLYSFISNLSQWNDLVCIPERKKEWIKRTGKLNKKDVDALNRFSRLFQESELNIENIFLYDNPQYIWRILSKKIGCEKTKELRDIFALFKERFNVIWSKDINKIKRIEQEFSKQKNLLNKNLNIIKNLCGIPQNRLSTEIRVRLILSSNIKEESQGFAYKNIIILECSGWPMKKINYLINNILLHESFHILFKQNKKLFKRFQGLVNKNRQILDKHFLKTWGAEIVFEEALVSSFIPEGYLTEKISGQNTINEAKSKLRSKKITGLERLRYQSAIDNYDIAKEYVEGWKVLDTRLLNHVISKLYSNIK